MLSPSHVTPQETVALLVAYNGKAFAGSQYQIHHGVVRSTVQGVLEQALQALLGTFVHVHLAGRTDAGVHAEGMVAHALVPAGFTDRFPTLAQALNAHLPPDVSVLSTARVDTTFHAQHSALWRWYRYRWLLSPVRQVWPAQASAWMKTPVPSSEGQHAVAQQWLTGLIGQSWDFASFKSQKGERQVGPGVYAPMPDNTLATVYWAEWAPTPWGAELHVVANRFVYHMVRNLAAVAFALAFEHAMPPTQRPPLTLAQAQALLTEPALFAARNWITLARPDGLSFMGGGYPDGMDVFADTPHRQWLVGQADFSTVSPEA